MWALPFAGEAKPVLFLQTQFAERMARVSPDGGWLAYTATESGYLENYVWRVGPTSSVLRRIIGRHLDIP